MRGILNYNFPKFDEIADILKTHGWTVINPADLDRHEGGTNTCPHQFDPHTSYADQEFMRRALARDLFTICTYCTAIYMLTGWEQSTGAKAEHATAVSLGLDIYYENPPTKRETNI